MAHKRIRPFNTKQTYPEQNLDNDLSQGVVARGTMVFLRGQVSQDLDSRESLHVGDAARQTEKTMQNINMLLEEAGSRLDHICRIVVYLTDIRHREAVYQEMGRWLKGVHPCSTGIVVPALARRMGCRDRSHGRDPGRGAGNMSAQVTPILKQLKSLAQRPLAGATAPPKDLHASRNLRSRTGADFFRSWLCAGRADEVSMRATT